MRESSKGFASVVLIVLVVVLAIGGLFVYKQKGDDLEVDSSGTPSNLSLPFDIENISFESAILNPFGIIRNNQDSGHGHGGIDFPLKAGSDVMSVADGEVFEISKVSNTEGDEKLSVLIKEEGEGMGWIFIYEHILVDDSLKVGNRVKTGDKLGTHILEQKTSHYQLTYVFDENGYTRNDQCWPELLTKSDQEKINNFWEKYRKTDYALDVWKSVIVDDSYSYLALLNEDKYPDGVQLCYTMNTDARVSL